MHKVASAASMKLMGVPVTENDPLGALSCADSPTNSLSGSTKSQTTRSSNYVEKSASPSLVIQHFFEFLVKHI